LGKYRWEVYLPIKTGGITVPAGFVTDLTSVPRLLWPVLPPYGRYLTAAIVHDYAYENALLTKSKVDRIFYKNMLISGVPRWKRRVMYWAVKRFGRGHY
jgi:hypothetical protein